MGGNYQGWRGPINIQMWVSPVEDLVLSVWDGTPDTPHKVRVCGELVAGNYHSSNWILPDDGQLKFEDMTPFE